MKPWVFDMIPTEDPLHNCVEREQLELVWGLVNGLENCRQRIIMIMRLNGSTLDQVGMKLGFTRSRIAQLQDDAIYQLRIGLARADSSYKKPIPRKYVVTPSQLRARAKAKAKAAEVKASYDAWLAEERASHIADLEAQRRNRRRLYYFNRYRGLPPRLEQSQSWWDSVRAPFRNPILLPDGGTGMEHYPHFDRDRPYMDAHIWTAAKHWRSYMGPQEIENIGLS